MRVLTMALALLLPVSAYAEQPEGIEKWQEKHPTASKELGDWVKAHPEAARSMFEWDGHHPERSKELVSWAIKNPNAGIESFISAHKDWPGLDKIADAHKGGIQTYLDWVRKHPESAEALMHHPKGLEWAGHHLYKEHWHLEHPKAGEKKEAAKQERKEERREERKEREKPKAGKKP